MVVRLGTAALLLSLLTACGTPGRTEGSDRPSSTPTSDAATDTPTEVTTPPASEPAPNGNEGPGTTVKVASSEFGPMLFDDSGQAIYLFDVETTSEPACYDTCAEAWPPVLTEGAPVAGEGVRKPLLGMTERKDGTTQVTYGGHPLYFYAHEGKGEVECHDVFLNGGTWYVVQPDGDAAPPT